MRGLLLLYLGFWVFSGPSTGDMEHISATLLCHIKVPLGTEAHGKDDD